MCAPILGAVVGIIGQIVSFAGAQQEYQNKALHWQQNYVNALAAGRDEYTQGTLRQLQEGDAYAQKTHMALVDEAVKASEADVAGAASGFSGISIDGLVYGIRREMAGNRYALQENWKMTAQQLQTEKQAATNRVQSRINSVERPVAPNPAALFVGILGAGVKAFGA